MATVTQTMRKLLNDPEQVVRESLAGLAAAHGDILRVDLDAQIVLRADAPRQGKVAVISGGGSGHEPLHGGFVGRGMLDAACPGAVFTSPTPDQMQAAIEATDGGAGALLVVKNYTGDVLNFETAGELVEGIQLRHVVIDDDVAVKDSLYTAGRRGVGGTVLLEKIAGAAAERGDDLDAVEQVAIKVIRNVRSMGLALTAPTVPHVGEPSFDLPDGEMEVGIGIHGEPGRRREPLGTAHDVASLMVQAVVDDLAPSPGTPLLVFTNSMGGTPPLELYLLHGEIERALSEHARGRR
jgi:dihydroxyacetone kinase-like protein